jgi:hypothetical protein
MPPGLALRNSTLCTTQCNYVFCIDPSTAVIYLYTTLTGFFLGAFAKLRKATVSLVMSVRPYGINSAPHGSIFMKFYI